MTNATKKLGKEITVKLKGIEKKNPVEQMATYFAIGHKLWEMIDGDEGTYGQEAMLDIVALVPQLKTEQFAYEIMLISCMDEDVHEFILKESATPMSNGLFLTPDHWAWLFRHQPKEASTEEDQWSHSSFRPFRRQFRETSANEKRQWACRELAWLRKESPSVAVLQHVEEILEAKHQLELVRVKESVRESFQDAISTLELF